MKLVSLLKKKKKKKNEIFRYETSWTVSIQNVSFSDYGKLRLIGMMLSIYEDAFSVIRGIMILILLFKLNQSNWH